MWKNVLHFFTFADTMLPFVCFIEPISMGKLWLFDTIRKFINWLKSDTLNSNIQAVVRMGIKDKMFAIHSVVYLLFVEYFFS